MTKLEKIEARSVELRLRALRKGGESLMERVDTRLGVVSRHCDRVRAGEVELTPGLEGEIDRCFVRAEELLVG